MTKSLKETASAGAISTGSIAVNTGGSGGAVSWQELMKKYKGKKAGYKPVKPFSITINEAFDLQDVLSRLNGIEGKSTDWANSRDNVTYGVEDDEGNIMKVTVRKPQAKEFEVYLAQQLGDQQQASLSGDTVQSVSMAELLFNLKDKFDIIDVDFPKIPTDVVYNADKASTDAPTEQTSGGPINNDMVGDDQVGGPDALGGPGGDAGGLGDLGAAPQGGQEGGLGGEDDLAPVSNRGGEIDLNNVEAEDDMSAPGADLLNGAGKGGAGGKDGGLGDLGGDEDGLGLDNDADGVTDFQEPTESEDDSILNKLIGLMKAQAEAETAKANAEAEKARAEQAESSARAADATIQQEEEIARMELEDDRVKDQEKRSKQLADIAKFRAKQKGFGGGLNEADANETAQMIRRQMSLLPQQWAVSPDDTPQTANYKKTQRINAMRELQARLRMAIAREAEARRLRAEGKNTNPDKNVQQAQNVQMQANQQAANQGSAQQAA